MGTASDDNEYKFIQAGDGSHNVCSATSDVEFDIYRQDGVWAHWYTVTNTFSVP
jgi:hypothetical protein